MTIISGLKFNILFRCFFQHIFIPKVVLLFFCYFPYNYISSQTSLRDSLIDVINREGSSISGLHASMLLSLEIAKTKPDSALQLLEKIIFEAKKSGDLKLLAKMLYTKGRIHENREQLDKALITYEEARKLYNSINDQVNVVSCLIQMGYVFHEKNESKKGLDHLKLALEISKEVGDKFMEAKSANGVGRIYSFLSSFDSSNIYLNKALKINQALGDKRGMAEIYTNIANNYGRASQTDKAIEHFLISQKLMQELNDPSGVSHTFRNIAVTYFFAGKYPEALQNLHNALNEVEGTDFHEDIIQNLDFLGDVYMTMDDFENAQMYWEKAGEAYKSAFGNQDNPEFLFKKGRALLARKEYQVAINIFLEAAKIKNESGQFIDGDLYWNLGQAYEKLSNNKAAEESYVKSIELSQSTNNYLIRLKSLFGLGKLAEKGGNNTKALQYFRQSYDLAKTSGLKENEMNAATGLYRIYKKQNNPAEALRYYEISSNIRDSIFSENNTKKIARMEAGFAFEKEKQELEFVQQKELANEANMRRILWIALVMVGLLLAIGLFYYRSKQRANVELSRLNKAISEQKAVVERQKEKLEALDEVKSRFFTNISHEFRTPLTVISGMVDQIREKPELWLERGTKMVKQNTLSLLDLVNQILDLRKLEANEMKVHMVNGNVVKYLRYLAESHQSFAASKGLHLHFLSDEEEIKMDYDPDKMLRIVTNLLSNSIKFTPEGGNVYLRVEQLNMDNNQVLRIQVQDTGVGIPEGDLPHIFGRFYQVDDSSTRKSEGTGIGLALTKELVNLLRGEIKIKSTLGKGSTFNIELPISNDSLVMAGSINEPSIQEIASYETTLSNLSGVDTEFGTAGKPSLLIVEDNPDVQQYLIACLQDDYQLFVAENGQIGVDHAIEHVPDLIVSDVMMPEKDGYELTEILKTDERTDHIPIILLTAKADMDSKISGLEKGADVYLSKPFEKRELLVRLEKLLELRKKLQAKYAVLPRTTDEAELSSNEVHPFLLKLYDLVEAELSNPDLDMNQLCRLLGMSRSQVFKKLKALTGKSATNLIRSYRLHRGKEMLSKDDLTISEVAYEVGFTSLNYFSSSYYEEFGERPSSIRK